MKGRGQDLPYSNTIAAQDLFMVDSHHSRLAGSGFITVVKAHRIVT
jgi:hypothetical protein